MTRLPAIEAGEALPLKFTSTEDLSGATVMGWISVNGGAVTQQLGSLDAGGASGYVPFPGSLFPARGTYKGEIVITLQGAIWSPKVEPFEGVINPALRPLT